VGRLTAFEGEEFDVVVIGGGIVGCGIARDAALRGLRVAVVEKGDFGGGTTSASTRIVHGGLRYLQMLDFRLVRLDLRERETLLRIAPHLVRPLEFFIPFFREGPASRWTLRAGLALYDALSFDKSLPSRRWLPPDKVRGMEPALERSDLRAAASYYDARVDSPERLALENLLDAEAHDAIVRNYCEAVGTVMRQGRVAGIVVRDLLEQTEAPIAGRVVVNATGAWVDRVTDRLTSGRSTALRTTKGVHIVCPPMTSHALVLFSKVDRRLLFAIPREDLTWIGTTDTDYAGEPSDARATCEDVEYILESVRGVFPALGLDDVLYTTAGVRALVRRAGTESSVSRMHRIVDGSPLAPPGMISVLGGKITGYRAIAEDVTDLICRHVGAPDRRCVTAETPLPGAGRSAPAGSERDGVRSPVTSRLYDLYGSRSTEVLALAAARPDLARPLSPHYPDIAAQVVFSARHEHCVHLSDFLKRRTLLGSSRDQGWDAAAPAATLMASELDWPDARARQEIESYRREIATSRAFRDET
jgi:glycerol-3-phosphate dehydrogenase